MNPELKSRLVDWAWLTTAVVVITYVVTFPLVWFGCEFRVGMAYRESLPPPPEVLQAQVWREFVQAMSRLPLGFFPWFTFVLSVVGLGIARDIYQTRNPQS